MTKKQIVEFIQKQREIHADNYSVYLDCEFKAMECKNLDEANKYRRWLDNELTLKMEYNYILEKITKE